MRKAFSIVGGSVVLTAAFAFCGCGGRGGDERASNPQHPVETTQAAEKKALPETAPPSETAQESREPLTLIGSVQSGAQVNLSARLPARIAGVYAREGDAVRKRQLLVLLDAAEATAQTRTAQAGESAAQAQVRKARLGRDAQRVKSDADIAAAQGGLQQAKTKLQQAILARDAARDDTQAELQTAQEGVRKAEAGLEQARRTRQSLEELAKVGGVSKADMEGARTQERLAQSDLDTARAQVRRLQAGPPGGASYRVALAQQDVDAAQAGVRQAEEGLRTALTARRQTLALAAQDLDAAQAALAQAQAGVEGAHAAQQMTRLSSPMDGMATNLAAHVDEIAQPGMPLVTVVSLGGLRVEALVLARQLGMLRVGQAAQVTVDTQPGRSFPIVVSEIARVAESDGRTFRVKFRFHQPVSLRPGQTARITVPPR
jgi:multidrug resistance efflux pump